MSVVFDDQTTEHQVRTHVPDDAVIAVSGNPTVEAVQARRPGHIVAKLTIRSVGSGDRY